MKTISVLFTGTGGLVADLERELNTYCPQCRILKTVDDSLIKEAIQNDGVNKSIMRRVLHNFENAHSAGADLIICACSSIGEAALAARTYIDIPIFRIDEAMIRAALHISPRIGVLASLKTTMVPTTKYVKAIAAHEGVIADVYETVAHGAYEAMKRGDTERHDELLLEAALEMKQSVDVILLAQGSMARMEARLHEAVGLPVLSSPRLCAMAVRDFLEGEGANDRDQSP